VIVRIGNKTLAGGSVASEGANDLRINGNRVIEEQEFCRGTEPDFVDRGQRRTVIEFTVLRMFATVQLCEQFILEHDIDTPVIDDVTVGVEDGSGGISLARYLRKASCQTLDHNQKGLSVTTRYRIVGGIFHNSIT
jgi:hypothetical protein